MDPLSIFSNQFLSVAEDFNRASVITIDLARFTPPPSRSHIYARTWAEILSRQQKTRTGRSQKSAYLDIWRSRSNSLYRRGPSPPPAFPVQTRAYAACSERSRAIRKLLISGRTGCFDTYISRSNAEFGALDPVDVVVDPFGRLDTRVSKSVPYVVKRVVALDVEHPVGDAVPERVQRHVFRVASPGDGDRAHVGGESCVSHDVPDRLG